MGVAARWGGHHGGQQRENVSSKLERWICARFKVPFLPVFSQDPAEQPRTINCPPKEKTHSAAYLALCLQPRVQTEAWWDLLRGFCVVQDLQWQKRFCLSLCVADVFSLHAVKPPALPASCGSMMVQVLQDLPSRFTIQTNLLRSLQTASADLCAAPTVGRNRLPLLS